MPHDENPPPVHNGTIDAACGAPGPSDSPPASERDRAAPLDAIAHRLRHLAHSSPFANDSRAARWWAVAMHTARDLVRANVLDWAASLAFYSVLSVFPLILISLILLSFFTDPENVSERAVQFLGSFLPGGEDQIGAIVEDAVVYRRRVGIFSALTFIYTGRRVLGALVKGLNHVSDVDPQEDDPKRAFAVELALFLGLLALMGLAMATRQMIGTLWEVLWAVPGPDNLMFRVTTTAVRGIFLVSIFGLLFQAVPRGDRPWRAVAVGAVFSAVAFLVTQGAFRMVLDGVWQNMNIAYGQIALAALLMTWAWIVALITLTGAGLASHVKVLLVENSGVAESSARHVEP